MDLMGLKSETKSLSNIVNNYVDRVKGDKAVLAEIEAQLKQYEEEIESYKRQLGILEQIRQLFVATSLGSREYVKDVVEEYMSRGLTLVFEQDIQFKVLFKEKRDQIEVDFKILIGAGGNEIKGSIEDAVGGGALDVMSVVMRIVVRNLLKIDSPFALDEPTKFLNPISSGNQIVNFGRLLKELCAETDTQVILVTHDKTLPEFGDKVFEVMMHNGVSNVRELAQETGD